MNTQTKKHVGETFTNQQVEIDEGIFEKCTFNDCHLVFKGGVPQIIECRFNGNITLSLTGAAGNTLGFLKGFYHGMGPGGLRMVEDVFNAVRQPIAQSPFLSGTSNSGGTIN
jgi:hypothetical protein